jgi:uroporphyrinogen-III synthase
VTVLLQTMSNVLFLKAPSHGPESPDRYESIFTMSGYTSTSVPVLETVYVNMEALSDIVRHAPQHGAVIITSGRACEAWSQVVDTLENEQASKQGPGHPRPPTTLSLTLQSIQNPTGR